MIAVRPATVEGPCAFAYLRQGFELQLLVSRRDSVGLGKALAMWRLTPTNSRAACDVLVLVDDRWVYEGEAATACGTCIISNANH